MIAAAYHGLASRNKQFSARGGRQATPSRHLRGLGITALKLSRWGAGAPDELGFGLNHPIGLWRHGPSFLENRAGRGIYTAYDQGYLTRQMGERDDIMSALPVTCRIYIVFHHALFAQGIRSLLRGRRALQVIGMESDPAKALEAVGSLQPEVVIVEESDAGIQSPTLATILQRHPAGRVVALDLDHNFATVYDRHRVVTTQPADLVKAIRGGFRDRVDPAPGRSPKGLPAGRGQGETVLATPARRSRRR